jgi:hypothetical protein
MEAIRSRDLEVRTRARQALLAIGKASQTDVLAAAARVLGHHKPAGTVEVLLNYLPSAEGVEVVEEVTRQLAVAGIKDGKPDPMLLKAAGDKLAAKRAAVGEVLAKGGPGHRDVVRKLLRDTDTGVRRRVAEALLEVRDKEAVPVLIDLLGTLHGEDADRVEDLLQSVAGDKAPVPPADATAGARRKYVAAWTEWWRANSARVDLSKVEPGKRILGYTLVAELELGKGRRQGTVYELDRLGKVRWKIEGLNLPVHAQVVRGNRVLVSEYSFNRVTERTTDGKIVWSKATGTMLLSARRLPNGHTFITTRSQLLEVDRSGKELMVINRPNDISAADRDRDGIGVLTTAGRFIRLDTRGREGKSFSVGFFTRGIGSSMQLLPRGRVLLPQSSINRVVECDDTGKIVWQANVSYPLSARRLANGHTIVGTRMNRVVELDKTGKEVWSKTMTGPVFFADRR